MLCILSISFWSLQHLLGLYHFCPLLGLSLAKMLHWYFQFSLRDLVFPLLLLYSSFIHCSLKKAFLSLHAFLWRSAFSWMYLSLSPLLFTSLLSLAICKSSSGNHYAFLLFFFFGTVLSTASCTISWTSFHSSSGTLSTRSNTLNLLPPFAHS